MPQNSVYCGLQTRDGYLWLGTAEGVARFDGVRFTTFDSSNTPAIRSTIVLKLYEGRDGTLWIATNGGGVTRYRQGRFASFTKTEGLADNAVSAIAEDRLGDLWIGTEGGLSRLHNGRLTTYTRKEGLNSDVVYALWSDRRGTLWIGTSAGLNWFRGDGRFEQFSADSRLASASVQAILEDRAGNIWVGTRNALYRMDEATGKIRKIPGLPAKPIDSLYEDHEGALWVATRGSGVCRLVNEEVSCLTTRQGLSNAHVWSVFGDHEGNVWIGTEGGGLNRLRDGKFALFGAPEGLSTELVAATYEDRSGVLWVGTYGGGAYRFENGRLTDLSRTHELSGATVWSFCESRDGALWIGTAGRGLIRWKDGRFSRYARNGVPADAIVASLLEDRAGNLWAGTSKGVIQLSETAPVRYTTGQGLSHNNVSFLHESRDSSLWIGTWNGLNRLREGKITAYTTKEGLSHDSVMYIHEDDAGTLWIGTYGGGLSRFRDGHFTAYTKKVGLFDNVVYQVLEDASGDFWMSSNKGLYRVQKKELNEFAAGKTSRIHSIAYDHSDGLRSVEFNGGTQNAGCITRDGRLWFLSTRGLVALDPQRLKTNSAIPPVYVEKVIADEQSVTGNLLREDNKLPPKKRLEFHYTALSLTAPEKVQFRYRLEGFDKEWVEARNRRVAYYTNPPPGKYRFRVIAKNNDGVWNEAGAAFLFSLRPRFYQTYGFAALCASGVIAAVFGGYRLRVRALTLRKKALVQLVLTRTAQLEEANRRLESALQLEERAHAVERELASVVRHAREAIVTWGADGRIESWNPAAEALYGLSADEAIGRHVEITVPESSRALQRATEERLLAGEKVPIAEVYRLRKGAEIQVEESLFLLPEASDRPKRIVSVARDLSEITRLQRATEILSGGDRFGEEGRRSYRSSRAMQEVLEAADVAAADRSATVLLLGETGSGKEWLARRIHAQSRRGKKPFFVVNCASLGPQLLESELFGHERGAFTGATNLKHGLVEVAEGGSLFLDEVGELSAGVQAQLLTFLDNRTFRRVGGTRNLLADVRILAATNADLKQAVERGVFRKDLYFRLSVLPIHIPPLRDRREEIPALASALAQEIARRTGRPEIILDREVTSALQRYDWPGNVRELSNTLERAFILSRGESIELTHLPSEIREGQGRPKEGAEQLEQVERAHILRVLEQARGNRTRAAKILGISRSTLKRKLAEPEA